MDVKHVAWTASPSGASAPGQDGRKFFGLLENETVGWVLLAVVAMIVTLLVDHLGLAGREARPVTLGRVLGAGFIFVGLALVLAYR